MNLKIPNKTKVVVIGGGVIGCSVAYHLAKFGWKDTIVLERDQLTSGTTWHAAGLVSQLGPSASVTKIRKYSLDLYKELEKKVDHSAGLRLNGALSIAQNKGSCYRRRSNWLFSCLSFSETWMERYNCIRKRSINFRNYMACSRTCQSIRALSSSN